MGGRVLVTGGAGYVGAHTSMCLAEAGWEPVVFDNLSNGRRDLVRWGLLEVGDIRDAAALDAVLDKHRPIAILHFAGAIEVSESVKHPGRFFDVNVTGTLNLIEAARRAGVNKFIFSSTCATYGEPIKLPIDESHPQSPVNPYGRSKLMVEQALADYERYTGFRSVCLRYFNAAGADIDGRIGEWHEPETHAIPLALDATCGVGPAFKIFGIDYETRDGTAVRDYVHVVDLAEAHVTALRHLLAGGPSDVFNLGTGTGTTVLELVSAIETVTGLPCPVQLAPRRDGDAPILVADNRKAREVLGWTPRYGLNDIVSSAWRWHTRKMV